MKYRLLHSQQTDGPLIITDIDQGLPIEHLDEERKQACYLPYNYKEIQNASEGGLEVVEDTSLAGYIDLVPSDKVELSVADGVIKGLETNGFLTVITVAAGDLDEPAITGATHDTATSAVSGTDDGLVTIDGSNFLSTDPRETTVELTDGATIVTVTEADIAGDGSSSLSDTQIVISAAVHGFATNGSEDITSITVTADGQSDTTNSVTIE